MKKLIFGLALALGLLGTAWAAGASIPMDKAPQRTNDMSALQNGAKLFVNYCLNCHSASFMRYNRLRDIGLTDKQIVENLTFATDKRRLRLIVDALGSVISKSTLDFGGHDLPLGARKPGAV